MYCIKCGQELPDNALFCCHCGENIQHNDLEKNDLKGELQEQELNSVQLINNSGECKTKKQLAKKAIVALIIVAIILIIGSGIIGFFRNRTVGRYNFNEIFEDYEQNSALASDKYDGKMIELEMCVDSIEKDYVSARTFWYDEYGNYDSFSIWVYFKSAEEIRDISVGDNVVFVGRIDDTPYDNPDLGRVSTIDLLEAEFVCKTDGHGHLISNQNFEHAKLEKKEYKGSWISNWEGKIYAMVIGPMGADGMPYMASIVEVGANKFWDIPLVFNEDGYFNSDSEDCFLKDEDDEKNYIYESSRCMIYSNYGFIIWESEKNGVIAFEEYDGDARELFSNSLVVEWTSEEEIIEEEPVTSLDDYDTEFQNRHYIAFDEPLSDVQSNEIEQLLTTASEKTQLDIVIVSCHDLKGKTEQEFADDFYDENGYGYGASYDGLLFLLTEDYCYISTCGKAISVFSSEVIDEILENIIEGYLKNGDIYGAYKQFISLVIEKNETDAVKEENNETATDTSLGWKNAYLDYLYENGNPDYSYSLDYIDGDDIPELIIDHNIAAEGVYLCTYYDGKVMETPVGEDIIYILQENSFCASGGRMGYYYDVIYEIVDGIPQEVSRGEYVESEYVEYDEYGYPIFQYTYYWNGELVSQEVYYAYMEDFIGVCSMGRGYVYDIIKVLEHPLDITIINSYIHNAGYWGELNQYVIMFNGIEDDKIHFTVTYNDELVGSVSATIIDATTAEYKSDRSNLVIRFDIDYQQLEIEGYMDTIDLTGSYWGMWG